MAYAQARRRRAAAPRKREAKASNVDAKATTKAIGKMRRRSNGRHRPPTPAEAVEGTVVVTSTENVVAVFPFSVAEACEGVQVDSAGAPVQLSAIVPVNPLIGVTCRL